MRQYNACLVWSYSSQVRDVGRLSHVLANVIFRNANFVCNVRLAHAQRLWLELLNIRMAVFSSAIGVLWRHPDSEKRWVGYSLMACKNATHDERTSFQGPFCRTSFRMTQGQRPSRIRYAPNSASNILTDYLYFESTLLMQAFHASKDKQ